MSPTTTPQAPTSAERQRDALLRHYDIDPTDDHRATLAAYRARTRRARWWGVIGAVVVGGLGLLGPTDGAGGLGIAHVLAGYLVGSVTAELLSPQRRAAGAVHAASLTTRGPGLLLPVWTRVLPWVVLVPCLVSPLLLLGDHPTGVTRVRDETGSARVVAEWFSAPALASIAVLAAVALVLWRLTLRRLARRRLPVDQPGAARLDLLTRALSARAASGAAAALGLSLLAGLAFLSVAPLHSMTCTTVSDCGYVYAEQAWADPLQSAGFVAQLAAIALFLWSRRPRIAASVLGPASEPLR